jgi:hypothetical protein
MEPDALPAWAEAHAAALLAGLDVRWQHVRGVARQAWLVARVLASEDRPYLVAAAWAATTTAATPPWPASSAWTSPTWTPLAGRPPAFPSRPPPAMSRCWPSWPRRWCYGDTPSRPGRPGRAGPATPWPAPAPAAAGSGWRGRCWSWPPSSVAAAPNRSSPRTARNVDAYVSMAAGQLPNRMELGSCRGWVLAWKQPRAVDAGKRGLGQPARHNASAATGAARGCRGRITTGSDCQSRRAFVTV